MVELEKYFIFDPIEALKKKDFFFHDCFSQSSNWLKGYYDEYKNYELS
jgi:hypothetical protein